MGEIMYIEIRCPVHNKPLYSNGQTSTHSLFKCPDCDYSGGDGAVRDDLPERYNELEAENKRLKKAIEDFGNNPAGFDWAVLEKIEQLEAENLELLAKCGHQAISINELKRELEGLE